MRSVDDVRQAKDGRGAWGASYPVVPRTFTGVSTTNMACKLVWKAVFRFFEPPPSTHRAQEAVTEYVNGLGTVPGKRNVGTVQERGIIFRKERGEILLLR